MTIENIITIAESDTAIIATIPNARVDQIDHARIRLPLIDGHWAALDWLDEDQIDAPPDATMSPDTYAWIEDDVLYLPSDGQGWPYGSPGYREQQRRLVGVTPARRTYGADGTLISVEPLRATPYTLEELDLSSLPTAADGWYDPQTGMDAVFGIPDATMIRLV